MSTSKYPIDFETEITEAMKILTLTAIASSQRACNALKCNNIPEATACIAQSCAEISVVKSILLANNYELGFPDVWNTFQFFDNFLHSFQDFLANKIPIDIVESKFALYLDKCMYSRLTT